MTSRLVGYWSTHVYHLSRAVGEQGAQRSLSHTLRHEQRLVGLHAEVLLAHRCLCTLWVDAVDAYAVGIPLLRHSLHEVDDWRQFINNPDIQLKGDEPDFSEEGWARRKPRKKK